MEMHERNQRTQQYVAGLQPFPPDDDMIDAGSTAETGIITLSDIMGPPSDLNGDDDH
jgi:hypothetical protein